MSKFPILDDELVDHIAGLSDEEQSDWLFLIPSEDFKGYMQVDSLDPHFFILFEDVIGPYRVIGLDRFPLFLALAEETGYNIAFTEDPHEFFNESTYLNELPPFSINSTLDGTTNGLFPWQIRGYNKLIRNEGLRGGLVIWATGTGKTAFIVSGIKHHRDISDTKFDLALVVVKSNNKIDTQRKLLSLGDIQSTVLDGTIEQRLAIYERLGESIQTEPQVVITNYEKFSKDHDYLKALLEDKNVIIFWDEMPTRLRSRGTVLYNSVGKSLYKSWKKVLWHRKRPAWLRQWELTATPIENVPEDQYSCIRLIDPDVLGTVDEFRGEYVLTQDFFNPDKPGTWHKLDKMGLVINHMLDQVDRDDPEVAKMFPEILEEEVIIDWDPKHRKLYDTLTGKAVDMLMADFSEENILSLISVMQMVCDAPSMLNLAAERREEFIDNLDRWIAEYEPTDDDDWASAPSAYGSEIALTLVSALGSRKITDQGHTKLDKLHELLTETHPDAKALVFTTWNSYGLPILANKLDEWGISYVTFAGTDKQKQKAKDLFRSDPSIRVFLSSDAGSDGIDLPEASVVINYNLPYKWTTKRQRRGRIDRVNSTHERGYVYDLTMANSIEDRKRAIIAKKHGYHLAIFKGQPISEGPGISREDLYWMLTGEEP